MSEDAANWKHIAEDAVCACSALRAQRDRLRQALFLVAWVADQRGRRLSPYYPAVLNEDAQEELGLLPGDVGPMRTDADMVGLRRSRETRHEHAE